MGVLGLYSYFESKSLGQRKSWSSPQKSLHHAIPSATTSENVVASHSQDVDLIPSEQKQRYFILDGNAYIHHLYCGQFEWIWGGQYSSFANLLIAHITALKSCGFQLQFLFDGPLPLQKLQTRLNRDTEKIHKMSRVMNDLEHYHVQGLNSNYNNMLASVNEGVDALISSGGVGSVAGGSRSSSYFLIPPLVMEVTLQTLRSLGVDLMVCDGEADGLVAQLAMEKSLDENVQEAYAVSKDSDYFIYDTGSSTKGGYIPLDSLLVSSDPQTNITTITANVYSQSAIADHLGIRPQFLPLFASLTGNDYLRPEVFESQIAKSLASSTGQKLWGTSNTNHARIKATAGFLKQYGAGLGATAKGTTREQILGTMERVLDDRRQLYPKESDKRRQELRSSLEESMQQYTPLLPTEEAKGLSGLSSPSEYASTSANVAGLHKMKEALRSGQFSFKLMDVVCNKMFWCTPFLEDTDRESAWLVSREMRRWIYGILARNLMIEEGVRADSPEKTHEGTIPALDVVEYVRRGDHLSAETVRGASSLELDEVLKTARAKAAKKTTRRVSVMDVDHVTTGSNSATIGSEEQDKAETMSIDISLEEEGVQVDANDSLDLASRTSLFLGILGADTDQVRSLPKPFMVLAATLRYLINALAHSKTRSASISIANFEVIAFVASVLFLRERYHPETILASSTEIQDSQQQTSIPSNPKSTAPHTSSDSSSPISLSPSAFSSLDEAPPLTKRSLHLSTQYQHALGTVSLLANALHLEDMIPPLATLFDGLLFQQTLAFARGGTLLEQRMVYSESVAIYHRVLAAIEEDFIDTGEIDVVVIFRAPSGRKAQHQQERHSSLGIFGPDLEPVNQLPTTGSSASSNSGAPSLKAAKAAGISKKSSGSSKKRSGGGTNNGGRGGGGGGRGNNGANMFNVLSLGCEF
ncbi:Protein asteroid 1 [Entomortierella chlamydospora]|nr:Protein asteroid 1 [Entomortierella chlamydospora]